MRPDGISAGDSIVLEKIGGIVQIIVTLEMARCCVVWVAFACEGLLCAEQDIGHFP